ncbi:16S rRNA (guanine(966)-N(2))-methyltransferase RsmD [Christensenellaceae bacterium OttesenSCG-928-L17]|nr:16S rRNA (guanine(966)-N(2))-methyltransferase RsmD [Christensenellaceae bacterium OttesenSCG-928-L17]
MRIIAGSAKGRLLLSPKGMSTRPTLDRVKESLFSILQFSLPNTRVLDLYAGTGSLGLEALSRGASHAVFNDSDKRCAETIQANIEALGFSAQATLLQMDAMMALARLRGGQPFDIVFFDPPYQQGENGALHALFEYALLAANCMVVVEHAWNDAPKEEPSLFRLTDRRKYRDTGISFFTHSTGKDARI